MASAGVGVPIPASLAGIMFMLAAFGFLQVVDRHEGAELRAVRVVDVRERTERTTDRDGRSSTQTVRELLVTSTAAPASPAVPPVPSQRAANGEPYEFTVRDQAVFSNPNRGEVVEAYIRADGSSGELRGINAFHLFLWTFGLAGFAIFLSGLRPAFGWLANALPLLGDPRTRRGPDPHGPFS